MDKIVFFLFVFLLAFALVIGVLWGTPIPQNVTGGVDETYQTLQHSGETVAQYKTTKWLAYLFGIGVMGIFSFFIFIGARKKDVRLRTKIYRLLGVGVFIYLLAYYFMVTTWWQYTVTNSMDYVMGLPKPTAWMVFGLMFTPAFISYFYITKFDEWVYTAEDERTFKEIMKRRERGQK